jgi:hypothetical protein
MSCSLRLRSVWQNKSYTVENIKEIDRKTDRQKKMENRFTDGERQPNCRQRKIKKQTDKR